MKFVLIGNVDHGKSTLGGRLLVDSNTIRDRDIQKLKNKADQLKMSNWWLAHILDEDDNEKTKGKTYSLNVFSFNYQEKNYELIDVPGHKELVNEMIFGTALADIAILIISIRKGEYEAGLSGQTLEHTLIARGMGISSLIVCINKMDTINWDQKEYNHVVADFTNKIKKYRFKNIIFVPISAYHGDNLFERYDNPLNSCSFMEALNSIDIVHHEAKLIQVKNKKVKGKFIFYHIKNLITKGYICKLHTEDQLYDAEFVQLKNDKLSFVTQDNSQGKVIIVILELNTNESLNCNVILRDGNQTIAIGILVNS